MYLLVDFGKINLKNLQKLQKLKLDGDDFSRVSGVKKQPRIDLQIHDQITHKAIPPSILRYLPDSKKIKYNAKAKRESFLPLINTNNQLKKGLQDTDLRSANNRFIERIANRVEGKGGGGSGISSTEGLIGASLRKRKLTKVEKIATNMQRSPVVEDLITTQRKPTQQDVSDLIQQAKNTNNTPKPRQPQKIRGQKPLPQTVEQKRRALETGYKRKALQAKYT